MRGMASFFPKALIFKEWRQQRMWALLLFLVMGIEPVLSLLGSLLKMWSDPKYYQAHWQVLHYGLLGITDIHGGSTSTLDFLFVGVAVFGATTLAYERSQGGLWYTLAGPFTRRQVLRVKVTVGWLFVIAIITLYALLFLGLGLIGRAGIPFIQYVDWWGYEVLLQGAMFMAAVVASTLVGNFVAAPIAGLVLAGAPGVVGTYVALIATLAGLSHYEVYHEWQHECALLSPMYYTKLVVPGDVQPLVLCGLVWIVGGYFVAQRLFHVSAMERMGNFYVFPVLWKWTLFAICLLMGTVFSTAFSAERPMSNGSTGLFLVAYVPSTAVCWFVFSWLIRLYRKKFLEA